jgi:putative flippase GtrA
MTYLHKDHNRPIWQFCWFGVFGLANTIGYFVIFHAAREWLTLPTYLSALAAYCTSVLISFVGNSRVTFKDSSMRTCQRVAIFMIIYLLGAGYNILCINVLVRVIGANVYPSLLFFIISWPVISFSLNKYFLFHDRLLWK